MARRSLTSTLIVVVLSLLTAPPAYPKTVTVISQVNISNLKHNSVTITWRTNKPAGCRIEYGETASYGSTTRDSRRLTTRHQVTIRRLKQLTSYHYRIIARDRRGVTARSEDFTFITTEGRSSRRRTLTASSATPASTTLTQPQTEEAVVSATQTPEASAADKPAPILYWAGEDGFLEDGVNPDSGYAATIFEFRIKYLSTENNPPSIHRVYIDKNRDGDFEDSGEVNDMISQGTDYINGVIYSYFSTIPYSEAARSLKYYFEFSDGLSPAQGGVPAGYSPQTAMDGPGVLQTLSISITPNAWNIGEVEVGTTTTMREADKVTVTNDGDGREDFTLVLANPDVWAADSQPGPERFVLNAAFSQYLENIRWDEDTHLVTAEPALSTGARFTGDQNGAGVSPGEARSLYLQFKSPTRTKIVDSESIRLIISCEVPKN